MFIANLGDTITFETFYNKARGRYARIIIKNVYIKNIFSILLRIIIYFLLPFWLILFK